MHLIVLEALGQVLYVAGFGLMAWALLTLGRKYQLGETGASNVSVRRTRGVHYPYLRLHCARDCG